MNQNKLSFQSQNLIVDYLEFKFNVLPEFIKQKIVQSFFKLGFNSFNVDKKYRDPVQDSIQTNSNNQYQIQFVVNVSSYWNGVGVDPAEFEMTQAQLDKLRDGFINYTRKGYTLPSIDHVRAYHIKHP